MWRSLFRNFIAAASTSPFQRQWSWKQWFRMKENYFSPIFIFFASSFSLLFRAFLARSRLQFTIFSLPLAILHFATFASINQQASSLSNFTTIAFSTCSKSGKFLWHRDGHTTSHEVITTNWDVRKDFPAVQTTPVFQRGEISTLFSRFGARADENFPPRERLRKLLLLMKISCESLARRVILWTTLETNDLNDGERLEADGDLPSGGTNSIAKSKRTKKNPISSNDFQAKFLAKSLN